jgi:5-methylcytosine-specific restriction enzyme subunit McrC
VCQLIFESTLPAEEPGSFIFKDFTRDHHKMNKLFEEFIRSFYRKEQSEYKSVKKEWIEWQFSVTNKADRDYLPGMETDISLENDTEKIIIDAKFYKDTVATYFDSERIHSANLYQLFSYLLNQQTADPKTTNATGILIYPTIGQEYNLSFKYVNHNIHIKTLNLDQDWKEIADRLKQIINV